MHNSEGFLSYNLTHDKSISLHTKQMCVMLMIVTNLHKVLYKHQSEESTLASAFLKEILIQDFSCMFFPCLHFISMIECFLKPSIFHVRIQIFWDVALCQWIRVVLLFKKYNAIIFKCWERGKSFLDPLGRTTSTSDKF